MNNARWYIKVQESKFPIDEFAPPQLFGIRWALLGVQYPIDVWVRWLFGCKCKIRLIISSDYVMGWMWNRLCDMFQIEMTFVDLLWSADSTVMMMLFVN